MIAIFVAIVMSIFLFFILKPKKMPVLELLFVWQITFSIYATIAFLIGLNMKWITYPDSFPDYSVEAGFRFIIVPLLITWALDWVYNKNTWFKLLSAVLFSAIIAGVHWYMNFEGYIQFSKHWNALYSFILFLMLTGIAEGLRKWFHRVLRTEVLS